VLIPSGFVYLFLYFNAQLKVMSDHRPAYWKMILTIAPLLGASLIAASLTVDEYHNWVSLSQVPARSGWPVWLMTVRLRRRRYHRHTLRVRRVPKDLRSNMGLQVQPYPPSPLDFFVAPEAGGRRYRDVEVHLCAERELPAEAGGLGRYVRILVRLERALTSRRLETRMGDGGRTFRCYRAPCVESHHCCDVLVSLSRWRGTVHVACVRFSGHP